MTRRGNWCHTLCLCSRLCGSAGAVNVTVTDDALGAQSVSYTYTETIAPTAIAINDATASPTTACVGQSVAFAADATSTCAGANLTYTWDFGDGNPSATPPVPDGTATGQNVTYTFSAPSPANAPYSVPHTGSWLGQAGQPAHRQSCPRTKY